MRRTRRRLGSVLINDGPSGGVGSELVSRSDAVRDVLVEGHMTSRRRFLGLSVGTAAGVWAAGSGALGIVDAVAAPRRSPWAIATWAGLTRSHVTATDAAGRRHTWTVSSVQRIALPAGQAGEAFTVRFAAARGSAAEGTYRISHPGIGRFHAFVTSRDAGAAMVVQRTGHG